MQSLSELQPQVRDALTHEMVGSERVLLVTRPSPRHAWGDGEVSMAESLGARALLGVIRVGLAGPIALQFLRLLIGGPVAILQESGFTLGALVSIVFAVVILGVMSLMVLYVASAPLLWMWHAAHCVFVVTDRAAYVIRDRGDYAIARRTPLPVPKEISLRRLRASGVGDVVLDYGSVLLPAGDGCEERNAEYDIGLLSVPDAERVAAVLRDAAQALHAAEQMDQRRYA